MGLHSIVNSIQWGCFVNKCSQVNCRSGFYSSPRIGDGARSLPCPFEVPAGKIPPATHLEALARQLLFWISLLQKRVLYTNVLVCGNGSFSLTTPMRSLFFNPLVVLFLSLSPAFAGGGKVIKPLKAGAPQLTPSQRLSTPFEMALISPIQIAGTEVSVGGLRINLIYGINANARGLDVGLVNESTGDGCGLEFGVSNSVGGRYSGIQGAFVNYVKSDFGGLQAATFNVSKGVVKGIQLGSVNYSDTLSGLQVGVFNVAGTMHGVQIGLVNISQTSGGLPFIPIINVSF